MKTKNDSVMQSAARFKYIVLAGLLILTLALIVSNQPAAQAQAGAQSVQDRPINSLRDLNNAFIDIAAHVKPTVVTVSTERIVPVRFGSPFGAPFSGDLFDFFFGDPGQRRQRQPQQQQQREYVQQGLGSGVIVGSDGKILTNNHVVANADSIFVRTFDGNRHQATVIGTDPETDIAVLQIDADGLPAIEMGNSDELKVGEMVLAIGSPLSENLAYTVTQGIVSAKGRSNVGLANYEDFIQTDAAINPGNSGGPLVNLDGQLIGINAAIASRSGGFQGVGFAVPVNMAMQVMNSLIANGKVVRGWLGVSIQDVNDAIANAMNLDDTHGALVGDVMAGSPAEKGGLQAGDVIIRMGDRPIDNSTQLRNRIAAIKPGTDVDFDVLREDKSLTVTVELGERPSDLAGTSSSTSDSIEELTGFSVATLTPELADRHGLERNLSGVLVTAVDQVSEAYRAGLREGDVIRAVDRQRVTSEQEYNSVMAGKQSGDSVLLRVVRQGSGFYIAFNL